MNSSNGIKIIIAALIVALIVFAGFKYLQNSNSNSGDDAILGVEKESNTQVGKDIVAKLMEVNEISLASDIFTMDAFLSLKDFTLDVVSERQGRNNPFAPFGLGGTQSTTTRPAR